MENQNNLKYRTSSNGKSGSGIINTLIRMGLAKDEAGANKVGIVIAVLCMAGAVVSFLYFNGTLTASEPIPPGPTNLDTLSPAQQNRIPENIRKSLESN